MASDVLVDNVVGDSALSSAVSSDNDEVNTSAARIYFGPLHPAERKIPRRASNQHTPVRRSSRLSALPASSCPAAANSSDEDENNDKTDADAILAQVASSHSVFDTLVMGDDVLEEPSSALASKVMRASDNPSPPPSPPASPPLEDLDNEADAIPPLILDASAPEQPSTADMLEGNQSALGTPIAKVMNVATPEPQGDLISFDAMSTPVAPVMTVIAPTAPSTPVHNKGTPSTVDDLLALTPFQLRTSTPTLLQDIQPVDDSPLAPPRVGGRDATPSVDEEAQVALVLSSGIFEPLASPSPRSSNDPLADLLQTTEELMSVSPEPDTLTPLRRSTRPRKSVSPFIAGSPNPHSSKSPGPEELRLHMVQPLRIGRSPRLGPARRRSSKGKHRGSGIVTENLVFSDHEPDGSSAQEPIVIGSSPPPEFVPRQEGPEEPQTTSATTAEHLAAHGKAESDQPIRSPRLRSLSPTSQEALVQLLSPRPVPSPSEVDLQTCDVPLPSTPRPQTSLQSALQSDYVHTPVPPVRPSTPPTVRASEISRTPARRIPIADAIAQGTASPQKDVRSIFQPKPSALSGTPVFRPRAVDDPTRTPAKRVPIANAISSLPSPQKNTLHFRPISPAKPVAPPPTEGSSKAGPGFFAKPSAHSTIPRPTKPTSSLPFPIITSKSNTARSPSGASSSKPSTSTLRQRAPRSESKIPRAGAKPYTRPPDAAAGGKLPSKSILTRAPSSSENKPEPPATATTSLVRPVRIRKVVSKPITVESDDSDVPPIAGPGPKTLANRAITPAHAVPAALSSSLKRKRDNGELHAVSPGSQPVVVIRKVMSGPSSRRQEQKAPATLKLSPPRRASPKVQSRAGAAPAQRIQMRKVINAKKTKAQERSSPVPEPEPQHENSTLPALPPDRAEVEVDNVLQPSSANQEQPAFSELPFAVNTSTPLEPETQPAEPVPLPEAIEPAERPHIPLSESGIEPTDEPASSGLRRTTRSRKSTPAAEASSTGRSAHSRRKTLVLGPPDTSVFSGMSVLALKTLTNTNTLRNQAQLASLEVEVVMKEGRRPDSPTTKVKTSLEKQKEEKVKEREARAARRARRQLLAAGGLDESVDANVTMDSSFATEPEVVDDPDPDGAPVRYRRGPGDESDYETPERPAKRGRFEGEEVEEVNDKNDKKVKWHKGLQTAVYVDDTPPRPNRAASDDVVKKGCLAPSSKTLPLDTMGNVLDANVPVPDLVVEHIVVKKFVYEDDEVETPAEPVAKSTRSKNKKVKAS